MLLCEGISAFSALTADVLAIDSAATRRRPRPTKRCPASGPSAIVTVHSKQSWPRVVLANLGVCQLLASQAVRRCCFAFCCCLLIYLFAHTLRFLLFNSLYDGRDHCSIIVIIPPSFLCRR